jgi:hypothetical protein
METILNTECAQPQTISRIYGSVENEIRSHLSLLNKIGTSFGFYGEELNSLSKEAILYASYHVHESELSVRIWCAKIMIQKCVFKISSEWLRENFRTGTPSTHANSKEIPLIYRTVYLLRNIIGFNESEISLLLNIDTIQVKDRLAKVHGLIHIS